MVETARAAAAHKELRRLYDSYWNFLEPAGPGVGGTSFIILILILILILIYHWRRPRLFTFFPAHTGPFINLPRRRPPGQEAGRTSLVRALSPVNRTLSSAHHSSAAATARAARRAVRDAGGGPRRRRRGPAGPGGGGADLRAPADAGSFCCC